jgi:hypothetical protein
MIGEIDCRETILAMKIVRFIALDIPVIQFLRTALNAQPDLDIFVHITRPHEQHAAPRVFLPVKRLLIVRESVVTSNDASNIACAADMSHRKPLDVFVQTP